MLKSPFVLILISFMAIGCQQKPTMGVTESGVLVQEIDYRKIIAPGSVIFDTRSPFEFNASKIPGSINLPLADFQVSKGQNFENIFDAARRLSLYGVNSQTPVVITGSGHGDEAKLAWEFIKLGVLQVETLKISVFRQLNLQVEPPQKNVPLWKPSQNFSELSRAEFKKKLESLRPQLSGHAQTKAFQGFPVAEALRTRVLVVVAAGASFKDVKEFPYVNTTNFEITNLFDDKGLLLRAAEFKPSLKAFDVVFLLDPSGLKEARAYALTQWGAKSLYLVK